MRRILTAFVVAGAGVGLFHLLNLPLPWLLGPMFSCLIAALLGIRMESIGPLNESMRTILGVAVGATLTPAVLATFPQMIPTLMLVPIMVICIGVVGIPYFQRLCGYDFPTAYYSSMPGGLQDMLVFGEEAGANVRSLSLIHATRVFVVVAAMPFLLQGIWQADLTNPPGLPATNVPFQEIIIMIACALIGWQGAKRIGMFGASILGPMIVTAAVTLSGFLHFRPPAEAIWAAQFFIGITIGTKYTGVTIREVKRDVMAGLGFCGLVIILTIVFVEFIYHLELAPGLEALLAFVPGGQAELTVLAIIVGADLAFVVAHHLLRLTFVIIGAPIAARVCAPLFKQSS